MIIRWSIRYLPPHMFRRFRYWFFSYEVDADCNEYGNTLYNAWVLFGVQLLKTTET